MLLVRVDVGVRKRMKRMKRLKRLMRLMRLALTRREPMPTMNKCVETAYCSNSTSLCSSKSSLTTNQTTFSLIFTLFQMSFTDRFGRPLSTFLLYSSLAFIGIQYIRHKLVLEEMALQHEQEVARMKRELDEWRDKIALRERELEIEQAVHSLKRQGDRERESRSRWLSWLGKP